MRTLDLNADLGEGFGSWTMGDDDGLLQVVTSASIACGFHAGDPSIMRRTCQRAADLGVAIGAHVSYQDLAGFGRRRIDLPAAELADAVLYQIGALDACARAAGTTVRYVKPHGALYNRIVDDTEQAAGVIDGIAALGTALPVFGLAGSQFLRLAEERGLPAIPEAFADRGYDAAGQLVPRNRPGAVLTEVAQIVARCVAIATEGAVQAIDGTRVAVAARSVCVHGDTPGALAIARQVRTALEKAGVELQPVT